LQLRQYPSRDALSLGLAPSQATLEVLGRQGGTEFLPFETPPPDATEFVDPATRLGENDDLPELDTWLYVVYRTPGGQITAWANSYYIAVASATGAPLRLRDLPVIPANRAGTTEGDTSGAGVAPTQNPLRNTVVGTVILNEGSNLQLRRNPNNQAESLALIPTGTQIVITQRTEDSRWVRTTYEGQNGWVATEYLRLSYNDRPYNLADVPVIVVSGTPQPGEPTSMTGTPIATPTATPELRRAKIAVDVIGLTRQPGTDGDGMPVLTRDTTVFFINYDPSGQFVLIQLEDGTQGWLPIYAVLLL
jgi:hypothetical protein